MRWSFTIARFADIDLKVHVTFLLILLLGAWQGQAHGWAGAMFGAGLMLLLFVCVTLHEFGHALVAQRLGIRVKEIILLPIGGVAMLSRNPDRAWHELVIAAAGPAVNVVIAGVLIGALALAGHWPVRIDAYLEGMFRPSVLGGAMFLLHANIALVLFNMIPAFPLDGGRIFRALLGFVMSWGRATRIAAFTGQMLAVALGALALWTGHIFLGIIAVLIYMSAGATQADERARSVLSRLSVGRAYNQYAITLGEHHRVSDVAQLLITSYQQDFAVLRGGSALLGVVVRDRVLEALEKYDSDPSVTEIMTRDIPLVDARLSLEEVRQKIGDCEAQVAAVFDGPRFLGLVSSDDIREAFAVLSFVGRQNQRRAQQGAGAGVWQG